MEDDYSCPDAPRKHYHSNWRDLSDSCWDEDGDVTPENHQYHTYMRLKKVLKEYSTCEVNILDSSGNELVADGAQTKP